MLNPNLPHLNGHGVAEPPASAALLESALDVLVDHTFATSLTCLIFLCVALELVRYWRAEEEKASETAGGIFAQIVWLASLSVCVRPRRVVLAHLSNTIY